MPRSPSSPQPSRPLPAVDVLWAAAQWPDASACYAALLARDRRFDGCFFVGVSSTGIYCRPVCSVRTPKAANCHFFAHAAAAEAAGFRPCLRCRPELAPGLAPIDAAAQLAWAAAQRIEAGELGERGLPALAHKLGITDRHLRRTFKATFGVTPIEYAQTQRLLLAKRLLTDTALPVTEVAFAAGFRSLRRFNDCFSTRYRLAPAALRRAAPASDSGPSTELGGEPGLHFELAWRPPYDWPRLLSFLAQRCIAGVEWVDAGRYCRSVRIEHGARAHLGWLSIEPAPRLTGVALRVSPSLVGVLPAVLARVRRLCDLTCEPQAVMQALGPLAADAPGLRVPGAFDGFEMAVRAVLGQQISVKAAHTLAARLVAAYGQPQATPWAAVTHVFPTPQRLAQTGVDELAALGIVRTRAAAIVALAREVQCARLDLWPSADVAATLEQLQALPGIGRWTAHYIALRALGWPDAWPSGDVALIKALGVQHAQAADALAEAWRPWRAYAAVHLWRRGPQAHHGAAPDPAGAAKKP